MKLVTSCARCHARLEPVYQGQLTHPLCESVEDERLAREFCDAIQREDFDEVRRLQKLLDAPRPTPKLGPSALWYGRQGWAIFPCRKGEKRPATKNGLKDATTDLDRIRAWWREDSEYNIGGVTGLIYDVLDIDGPQGWESVRNLDPDVFPEIHGRVNTPRGQHWYMKKTGDGNRAGIRPGLDFRGISGYVLLPASVVDGKRYSWAVPPSPEILRGAV